MAPYYVTTSNAVKAPLDGHPWYMASISDQFFMYTHWKCLIP